VHFKKEHFPSNRKSKLTPRAGGPSKVLERINNNVYNFNLLREYKVTFNVADLSPYMEDDTLENLKGNSSQQWENEGDQVHKFPKSREAKKVLQ